MTGQVRSTANMRILMNQITGGTIRVQTLQDFFETFAAVTPVEPTSATNTILGANAGDSIEAGGLQDTLIGNNAGTAISTGDDNVAIGYNALDALTTGGQNIAIGTSALSTAITTSNNIAIGYNALLVATGANNTIIGHGSGDAISTGASNTAVGLNSLGGNVTGSSCVAIGKDALAVNTVDDNVAVGTTALSLNNTGLRNTAVGKAAGFTQAGITDDDNTWIGYNAGLLATGASGGANVAVGSMACDAQTSADRNTACGAGALSATVTGGDNVAVGNQALNDSTVAQNTAVGSQALALNVTGLRNAALGYSAGAVQAGVTDDDNTLVGFQAGSTINGGAGGLTAVGSNTLQGTTGANVVLTGTIDPAADTAVAGVGTAFTTELVVGDQILVTGETRTVTVITDNTNLTVSSAFTDNANDETPERLARVSALGATAIGYKALNATRSGARNTAVGFQAGMTMFWPEDADNTLVGYDAGTLINGSASGGNTALGSGACDAQVTANNNTGIGFDALGAATAGSNTAVGKDAGLTITTGSGNVLVGLAADVSAAGAQGQFTIGTSVACTEDNQITIGNAAGIVQNEFDTDANWSQTSDFRKKRDIRPFKLGLDFIAGLNPVTYQWRPASEWPAEWDVPKDTEIDTQTRMSGLIAQDVRESLKVSNEENFAGWSISSNGQQRISREMFVLPLIRAVQQLLTRVEELEAKYERP